VGEGDEKRRLERLIVELGLTETVKLVGFQKEIEHTLLSLDIFVLPSVIEGFPMILLEAGAIGIPIIASTVGGIPELIRDGTDGLLVPQKSEVALANAITRVANDPSLGEGMAEKLRSRIQERFTLERMTKNILEVYRTALR